MSERLEDRTTVQSLLLSPEAWRARLIAGRGRWRGHEPASERTVRSVEQRLCSRLPPGYRTFLLASDGWPGVGSWIDVVHACDRVAWFRDTTAGARAVNAYEEFLGDPDDDAPRMVFERSLSVACGQSHWLLDPHQVDGNGEWAAWRYAPGQGEMDRFASFAELFEHCRRESVPVPASRTTCGRSARGVTTCL